MHIFRWLSAVAFVSGTLPTLAHAWTTVVPASPLDSTAFAVTTDENGDVAAAGRIVDAVGSDDGLVVKLGSADGAILWREPISGTLPAGGGSADDPTEVMRAVVAAAGGDVVVAGRVIDEAAAADLLVARRAGGDGAAVWHVALDGGAAAADDGQGVALDASGDVLVAGALTPSGAAAPHMAVLKLAGANGAEAWRALLDGEGGIGRAVGFDANGDVVVAGDVGASLVVSKRAGGDGAELWRTDVTDASADAVARALSVLPDGGSVVAGRLGTAAGGPDFAVVALDAAGGERWRRVLDGTAVDADDADEAFAVAIDAAGDVIAAGRLSFADTSDDLLVVKLDGATGDEVWRTEVDGSNSRADEARAVAITPAGDVAVAGSIRNAGSGRDLAVLLLAGTDGTERWRRVVDGAASAADVAFGVAVDPLGHVVVSGRTRNGDGSDSFTVLKLAGATGGDYPCGDGMPDAGEACDDGNGARGDGCRPDCTEELCGDGVLDPQEGCDDGNQSGGDCCGPSCLTDPDGTGCDDANACTTGETCTGGTCAGGAVTVCTPPNDCHDSFCDPATGVCLDVSRPNGRLCNDGDACTVLDWCSAGTCQPGNPLACDDFEPCTTDACHPDTGCANVPAEGFDSVRCAFDRERLDTFCFAGLPRAIDRGIDRAERLVDRAAEAARPGKARRLLKQARKRAVQTRRRAARQAAKVPPACWAAVDDILDAVATRAAAFRETLPAP